MKYLIFLLLVTSCGYDVYEKDAHEARLKELNDRYVSLSLLLREAGDQYERNKLILNVLTNRINSQMEKICREKLGEKATYRYCSCTLEQKGVSSYYRIPDCENAVSDRLFI